MLNKNKIESLLSLVDDQDEAVYELIHGQIMDYGREILPFLNKALDHSQSEIMNTRLSSMVQLINLLKAKEDLKDWKNNNSRNLYQGLITLSKFQYPKLDLEKIARIIGQIRQELWLEINDNMTALEKVRILNHLIFDIHLFRGDSKDYFAPENSFLNDVLLRKKGNPITLSAVYSIIAQSVNIPIYGVNMPNHFILAYTDRLYTQPLSDIEISNVLFYINPFNRGEIYSLKEMRHFLTSMKMVPRDLYLLPCANTIIIRRSLNNLINIYDNQDKKDKADDFRALLGELDQ